MLPAGAIAGWDLHPLESAAFARRTPLANFDLEQAIALRWALRDILGNRLKLSPVKDDDLRTLIDLGFVEMTDDSPVVTPAGLAALQ